MNYTENITNLPLTHSSAYVLCAYYQHLITQCVSLLSIIVHYYLIPVLFNSTIIFNFEQFLMSSPFPYTSSAWCCYEPTNLLPWPLVQPKWVLLSACWVGERAVLPPPQNERPIWNEMKLIPVASTVAAKSQQIIHLENEINRIKQEYNNTLIYAAKIMI